MLNLTVKKYAVTLLALCAVFMLTLASCAGTSEQSRQRPPAPSISEQNNQDEPAPVHATTPSGQGNRGQPAADEREKHSVAVYMAGEELAGIKGAYKILGGELARALSGSDKYAAVNRTDAILEILGREHVYQRSGAFMKPAANMRNAFRSAGHPEDEAYALATGFRLALKAEGLKG